MKINVVFEVSGYKCWQLTFLQTTDTSKVAFVDSGAVIIRQTADHSSSHTTGYLFKVIWEYFKTFFWGQICFLKGILHKFQIVVVAKNWLHHGKSDHLCGDQNKCFQPNHNVLLILTTCFSWLNLTTEQAQDCDKNLQKHSVVSYLWFCRNTL